MILLNGERLTDYAGLRRHLRQARRNLEDSSARAADTAVIIAPGQVVQHRHVVAAFDAAIDAGFKDIQFTVPQ